MMRNMFKVTINIPEHRHRCRSGVLVVSFEDFSNTFLVFLLTLNKQLKARLNIDRNKASNKNTRKKHEICSKLTIKTLERHHWRRGGQVIPSHNMVRWYQGDLSSIRIWHKNSWSKVISGKNPHRFPSDSTDWWLLSK